MKRRLLLRRAKRERRSAERVVAEVEAHLARRLEALGAVRAIGHAGLVDVERGEQVALEVAALAGDLLRLGPRRRHCCDPNTFGPRRATSTSANRNKFFAAVRKWRRNTRRGCKAATFAPARRRSSRIFGELRGAVGDER